MSDDDDFMSDSFLQADTRPGVAMRASDRRRIDIETRQREAEEAQRKRKRGAVAEAEAAAREEGLTTPLPPSNKGFALLQKLGGYSGDGGLGPVGRTGRAVPVQIEMKAGRGGVGHAARVQLQAAAREQAHAMVQAKRAAHGTITTAQFVQRQRNRFAARQVLGDLRAARVACAQLDGERGLAGGDMWPVVATAAAQASPRRWQPLRTDAADDELCDTAIGVDAYADTDTEGNESGAVSDFEQLEPGDQLRVVSEYLRNAHAYCVWCGRAFDDAAALARYCPGLSRGDHDDGNDE